MKELKKLGYWILLGVVLYFLSMYIFKIFGWILNIALLLALVAAAYWLYKKLGSED
tara:strand:- start:92 stop:259 length:168 start_codon:yes stop_codon:yes gene_type:complete